MLNPYPKLRALAAAIRTLWRRHVVGDSCSRCDVQVATRYVENLWLTAAQLTWTYHGKDGWDYTTTSSGPGEFTGWLCVACARALGVESPDRDDR
jgi:hypothetical protein